MKVGSLFAGIGGFDLGLERAGFTIKWQVEIDPYCNRVLAKHWPTVPRYGDIRAMDWGTVEPVDVLCGGFPCQDISLAGKGAGLSGARSGLWSEYVKAIDALTPRYILIENVAALRSRGLDQVLREIAALGYDAEWHCIPASAVGAPHRRDRVWIVAYATRILEGRQEQRPVRERIREGRESIAVADTISQQNDTERGSSELGRDAMGRDRQAPQRDNREAGQYAPHGCREDVADTQREGSQGQRPEHELCGLSRQIKISWDSWWESEPAVCELADGVSAGLVRYAGRVATKVPNRVQKLKGLGNAIVPQIAEALGRMILELERAAQRKGGK